MLQVLQDDGLDLKGKLARIKEILTAQEKALAIFDEAEGPSPASTQGSAAEGADSGAASEELAGMSPVVAARLAPIVARNRRHELADLVRDGHLTRAAADGLERLFVPAGEKALQLSIDQAVQVQFDGVVAALQEEPGDRDGRADRPAGDGPGPALDGRRSVRRRDAGADEDRRGPVIGFRDSREGAIVTVGNALRGVPANPEQRLVGTPRNATEGGPTGNRHTSLLQ